MSQFSNGDRYEKVKSSFGPNAHQYTISPGHSDQQALAKLVELVAPQPGDRLLDIGTGAGHTAVAFAPQVAEVIAYDLTPQMLEETQRNAAQAGVTNLSVRLGAAEALPFEEESFELVTCRLTTHHFADLPCALGEMARVLKADGRLVIIDTTVPEDPELDRQINEIEILRDPSHVRNSPPSEWQRLVEEAGLTVTHLEKDYYDEGGKMDFGKWTRRIGTSPENIRKLENLFHSASPALVEALQIEATQDKIGFALPRLTLIAIK